MNRNSWEAVQRSSAVGVELYNPMYDQLRAATRAALDAEGLTLENLVAVNEQALATEAEIKKAQKERRAAEHAERVGNNLFLTAAVGLLPRGEIDYEGVPHFETKDRDEAYHILDTAVWFGKRPYWVAGYRYTDNTALFIPVSPTRADFEDKFRYVFHDRYSDRSGSMREFFSPYKKELRYYASDRPFLSDRKTPLEFSKIPENLRFALHATQAYIFTPARKDRKPFKEAVTADLRPQTIESVASTYNHSEKAFVIDKDSPRIFTVNDARTRLDVCHDDEHGRAVSTNVLNDFNVFDGLLRLMTRFDKGNEYLQIIQRAKDGDIEKVVMEQQGIPILASRQETEKYLYDKARNGGWIPKEHPLKGLSHIDEEE